MAAVPSPLMAVGELYGAGLLPRAHISVASSPFLPSGPVPLSVLSQIVMYRGDMLALGTKDGAIVNAANAELAGGGGVTGQIFEKFDVDGSLSKALEAARGGRAAIEVGSAVATTGHAGLKAIVHAVGPKIAPGAQPSAGQCKELYNAWTAALTCAANEGAASVAVPCLSTGIYNFPA